MLGAWGRVDQIGLVYATGANMRRTFIAVIAVVCLGTPTYAQEAADGGYKAMVEVTSHQISINSGQGFQQVDGIIPVSPGDLVMASEAGRGWIVYPDCDVEVLPGRVYTVEDRPGVVRVQDAKEFRPACKKPVPWWLLAAVPILACAAHCFDDDEGPASP